MQKAFFVGCILIALQAAGCNRSPSKYAVLWEQGGGAVPDRFAYLCFPATQNVPLLDQDLKPTGVYLTRALMCTERELRGAGTIGVFQGKQEFRVQQSLLTPNPNVPDRDSLVVNWKDAVKSWGDDTDWNIVDANFESVPNGSTKVTLKRKSREGVQEEFQYSYSDRVHAQKWLADKASRLAG
jgi:hypothetical protein